MFSNYDVKMAIRRKLSPFFLLLFIAMHFHDDETEQLTTYCHFYMAIFLLCVDQCCVHCCLEKGGRLNQLTSVGSHPTRAIIVNCFEAETASLLRYIFYHYAKLE